jgi:mono/diheme cytochrome c family protein/plastocyanin
MNKVSSNRFGRIAAPGGAWLVRSLLILLVVSLLLAFLWIRQANSAVEVHAAIAENGGWMPDTLTAEVGVPLKLQLISDDAMHGFAVGQTGWPAVDMLPRKATEVTLTFDEPGTYTYYCTRWCSPNHWRMRGTIVVTGDDEIESIEVTSPLYVDLGLDIDADHQIDQPPVNIPSAANGASLNLSMPASYFDRQVYLTQSPYDVWESMQAESETAELTTGETWDLVAAIWQSQSTLEEVQLGETLYGQNCAACHGAGGAGDGAMGNTGKNDPANFGREFESPTDFTDSANMLGASTALLDGKIRRGGMGTGMPYWGKIFTDDEIEALIAYLWTFQFPHE